MTPTHLYAVVSEPFIPAQAALAEPTPVPARSTA